MADVITYLDSQPNQNSQCKCDVYPFMVTKKTWETMIIGCEKNIGEPGCNDCCWMCFPFSITIDIITLLPFLTIYTSKKCL
jgi:hypothetical protein